MSAATESERIRSLRPDRQSVDLSRPIDVVREDERWIDGALHPTMTVFLAGSECPFTCNFCDLWRYTTVEPTPVGALPRQLEIALAGLSEGDACEGIKLYNASNFFDERAVPAVDRPRIAELVADFDRITVECHPRMVGESALRFAERLSGQLEIAMGLETIHPLSMQRLNKRMTPEDFEEAARRLRHHGIGVRAFVLLSPPGVPPNEAIEWLLRTIRFALDSGVETVAVIPVRTGNGELERLEAAGLFERVDLKMFEAGMARATESRSGVVLADLWDVGRLSACDACRDERIAHLESMNRTGVVGEPVQCRLCDEPTGGS